MAEATAIVRLDNGQKLTADLICHIAKIALDGDSKMCGFGTGTGITVNIYREGSAFNED